MRMRLVLVGLFLALGTLLGASPASAHNQRRTLIVDDDGADCHRPDARTIQEGVNLARPGDTVRVCEGTYAGGGVGSTQKLTLQAKGG